MSDRRPFVLLLPLCSSPDPVALADARLLRRGFLPPRHVQHLLMGLVSKKGWFCSPMLILRPPVSKNTPFCSPDELHSVNLSLQGIEEGGGMGAVHLGVMELEGDGEDGFEETFPVLSPDHEGVVEDAAVHSYRSVNLGLGQG